MTDLQRLSRVFVELADTLVADFDVIEFLTMLTRRCVELLDGAEAGVVLADERGALRSVASSHESARLLELFELQNEEGPCLDCYQTGNQIVNHVLTDPDQRWPKFAPEARRVGFTTIHAFPMMLRGQVIGAVNVFAVGTGTLSPDDVELAQALADVATVGLLQERSIREARVLNEQLQSALSSRIIIEQAKGMLAERRQIDMDAAFHQLRDHARRNNRRLSDVAHALLTGELSTDALGHQ